MSREMIEIERTIAEALQEISHAERLKLLRRFAVEGLAGDEQAGALAALIQRYGDFIDTIDELKAAGAGADYVIGHESVKQSIVKVERASRQAFASLFLLERERDQQLFWQGYLDSWVIPITQR